MKKFLKNLFDNSRELVIGATAAVLILIGSLHLISVLTGRATAVSLVPLVEFSIALIRFTVCGAAAALFQVSAIGYRDRGTGGNPLDDIFDAVVFLALFILALVSTCYF